MATVNKNFRIKNGLVVEGSTATVNGYDILTKVQADQDYIISLIGGSATPEANANAVVLRDTNASFAANVITADLIGDVTGQVSDISNHDTDDLAEGTTNLYFSNARATDAVVAGLDTDDLTEGSTNLYFSNVRAQDATAGSYDVLGAAGDVAADLSTHEGLTSNIHGVTGNVVGTSDTQTLSNKSFSDAITFTGAGDFEINGDGNVVITPGAGEYIFWGSDILATQAYASEYTDNSVAALVDSAPELLNTLAELANAIAENPNYATDMANSLSQKQNTLTVGQGIDITADTIAATLGSGLAFDGSDDISVDRTTVDGWYDANGSAATAQTNAQNYADGLANNYEAANSIATALAGLDTDDIAEGTNLYFSNVRATDAVVAGLDTDDLSEGSTNLYFSNARATDAVVAGLDTDDLTEGSTNLYFSNVRATSAIQDEVIYPASVTTVSILLNGVRQEEANFTVFGTASTANVHSFSNYDSAKYIVTVAGPVSGTKHSQITEILLTTDGNNNIAITEYGTICTHANNLASFSADYVDNTYQLIATAAVACEVVTVATLLNSSNY
jgi:hypothetical protein